MIAQSACLKMRLKIQHIIVLACNFRAVILEHSDMLRIYPHSIHGMSELSRSPGANKSQSDIDLLTETDGNFQRHSPQLSIKRDFLK